jgi:hypothetical protein
MAKKPTTASTDPVAALREKTAQVGAAIKERDALLGEQLTLERGGVEPDVAGLRTMETLTGVGLLNGVCLPGLQGGLRLAYILQRRETLARDIERGRAEEEGLRHDAAPFVGADELAQWNAAVAEQAKLLQALDRNREKLFAINEAWTKKTGVGGLPMADVVLADDPRAARVMLEAVQGFAESAATRGDDDASPMTRANEPWPPVRRY